MADAPTKTPAKDLTQVYKLKAALAYARRGVPVFPCKPGGKEPLTPNGHLAATTDERQIGRWWRRWPGANIGAPTGERSGFWALDVDNFTSFDALTDELGELPETAATKTGGAGMHLFLKYPAGETIRNSADKLGPGLDVRGEGGYVVLPPSRTESPYEWLDSRPIAEPPAGLLEAVRRPSRASSGASVETANPEIGEPIPEGQRNDTLTRIAGKLRARGHDQAAILDALTWTNETKCETPLPEREVEGIAQSAGRWEPGTSSTGPDAETLEALEGIERELLRRREWSGMAGKSERDVVVALVKLGREHGQRIPAGVRVQVSIRALALAAALSKRAATNAVQRLKAAGVIRGDNADRSGTKAGALVLLDTRATVAHSTTRGGSTEGECASGLPLRAPRLRWSAPEIARLGKSCGAVLDVLDAAGGSATVEDLADALHVSRPRDLRRRVVSRLEEAGVVECSGNTVSLVGDWLDALNDERERAGEIAAARRDMARYARERRAYANRGRTRPGHVPERREREPDGRISDLEKLPPPVPMEALYSRMGQTVQTRYGPGELWQAFSDQVGVILDAEPAVVTFMHPAELRIEGVVESMSAA